MGRASPPATSSPADSTSPRTNGCSPARAEHRQHRQRAGPLAQHPHQRGRRVRRSRAATPTLAGNPGPWITWQETSTVTEPAIEPRRPSWRSRSGRARPPARGSPRGSATAPDGGFCWQRTGIARFGSGTLDPSLNVDPTRDGVEPDIAFAGAEDTVPPVVLHQDVTRTTVSPLHSNDVVAKGCGAADGGFHWQSMSKRSLRASSIPPEPLRKTSAPAPPMPQIEGTAH